LHIHALLPPTKLKHLLPTFSHLTFEVIRNHGSSW
jgi:hypothetical protein